MARTDDPREFQSVTVIIDTNTLYRAAQEVRRSGLPRPELIRQALKFYLDHVEGRDPATGT